MADVWREVFKGTIESRAVRIEAYDEGGWRVTTNQEKDDPGSLQQQGPTTLIMTPTEAGREIEIEAESESELMVRLSAEGFSQSAIEQIIRHIR